MYENDGAELIAILRRVRADGVTTSLDMTFPDPSAPAGRADWVKILRGALPYVDIFLPSIEEILFMLRRATYEELRTRFGADLLQGITPELLTDLGDELLGLGVKIAGLKLGERGFYLRTADRAAIAGMGRAAPADPAAWADQELWAPCFRVEVVGTTGAGDAAIAGFIAGLLRGLSPAATLTAAVAVGACNVEAADALSGIRPWDETLGRIAAGWPRRTLTIDAAGWRFDAGHGLWVRRTSRRRDATHVSISESRRHHRRRARHRPGHRRAVDRRRLCRDDRRHPRRGRRTDRGRAGRGWGCGRRVPDRCDRS